MSDNILPMRLLCICYETGHAADLLRLVRATAKHIESTTVAFAVGIRKEFDLPMLKYVPDFINEGATCINFAGSKFSKDPDSMHGLPAPEIDQQTVTAFCIEQSAFLRSLPPPLIKYAEPDLFLLLGHIKRYRELLERTKPSLVVLCEDNVDQLTGCLIKAAKELAIPVVVFPFTMPCPQEPANHIEPVSWEDQMAQTVGKKFPKWIYHHKGWSKMRVPPIRAVAWEILGLAPPCPWMYNSGSATKIALDCQVSYDFYLKAGFPANQLTVTGSLIDDTLLSRMQDSSRFRYELATMHDLPHEKPLVLWAVSPDQTVNAKLRTPEVSSYAEKLISIATELRAYSNQYNIIAKLHPRIMNEEVTRLIEGAGIKVTPMPTEHLIPICHAYIASCSSTIRWALACGIPVINYDFWHYHFRDILEDRFGAIVANSHDEFVDSLKRVIGRPELLERATRIYQQQASKWGMLDGCTTDRALGLFASLIDAPKHYGRMCAEKSVVMSSQYY